MTSTAVWTVDCETGLTEVDPETGDIAGVVDVGILPYDVAADGDDLWIADFGAPTVHRLVVGGAGPQVTAAVTTVDDQTDVVAGPEGVWASDGIGTVSEIDRATSAVTDSFDLTSPQSLELGESFLWVLGFSGVLHKIDPATNAVVASAQVSGGSGEVESGFGAMWVTDKSSGTLLRVDPESLEVTDQIVLADSQPLELALGVGAGGIWVSDPAEGMLNLVDPESVELLASVGVGRNPRHVTAGDDSVWVTVGAPPSLVRVDRVD